MSMTLLMLSNTLGSMGNGRQNGLICWRQRILRLQLTQSNLNGEKVLLIVKARA